MRRSHRSSSRSRLALGLVTFAGGGCAGGPADAPPGLATAAPAVAVAPAAWALADVSWAQAGDLAPTTAPSSAGGALQAEGEPEVQYLNFCDGTTTLTKGPDDATRNVSQTCGHTSAGCVPFTGSEAFKKTFVAGMQELYLPFNVVFVTRRPASGPYAMELLGPTGNGCDPGGVAGIGPADCGNRNKTSVAFTFYPEGVGDGTPGWVIAASEIGHALGLSHVDTACDVMGAGYSRKGCPAKVWGFQDQTNTIIGSICGDKTENSYQLLASNVGLWPAGVPKPAPDAALCDDEEAPTVRITEPADGASVANAFSVEAEASDDCPPVARAHISLPSQGLEADSDAAPFAWALSDLPDTAAMDVVVEVWDGKGRSGSAKITVRVGNPPPGSGGSGGGGASGNGQPGPGEGGASPSGCSVAGRRPTHQSSAPSLAALLGVALAARRLRARRAAAS